MTLENVGVLLLVNGVKGEKVFLRMRRDVCICVYAYVCVHCQHVLDGDSSRRQHSLRHKRSLQAERKCTFSFSQGWGIGGDQLES